MSRRERSHGCFRYGGDPVCVLAVLLYLINRCWWKPCCSDPSAFVHCYFGDVLCLPVCVPIVLWLQRRLGLRSHDRPPSVRELASHWLLWSCCFEWLGPALPTLAPGAVADPLDAVAYAAGGVLAALLWRSELASQHGTGRVARFAVAIAVAVAVLGSYRGAAVWRGEPDNGSPRCADRHRESRSWQAVGSAARTDRTCNPLRQLLAFAACRSPTSPSSNSAKTTPRIA